MWMSEQVLAFALGNWSAVQPWPRLDLSVGSCGGLARDSRVSASAGADSLGIAVLVGTVAGSVNALCLIDVAAWSHSRPACRSEMVCLASSSLRTMFTKSLGQVGRQTGGGL